MNDLFQASCHSSIPITVISQGECRKGEDTITDWPRPCCGLLTPLWCLEFGDDVSLFFSIFFNVMRWSWVPNRSPLPGQICGDPACALVCPYGTKCGRTGVLCVTTPCCPSNACFPLMTLEWKSTSKLTWSQGVNRQQCVLHFILNFKLCFRAWSLA